MRPETFTLLEREKCTRNVVDITVILVDSIGWILDFFSFFLLLAFLFPPLKNESECEDC